MTRNELLTMIATEDDTVVAKILFNRARCRKCGTVLESKTVHDLQTCTCGAISIDGGREYIRQIGNEEDIEDLSEYAI